MWWATRRPTCSVMIRTGQLLADLAEALGYEKVRTDLIQDPICHGAQRALREEVVIFRWPGRKGIDEQMPSERRSKSPAGPDPKEPNRYAQLILEIRRNHYVSGAQ